VGDAEEGRQQGAAGPLDDAFPSSGSLYGVALSSSVERSSRDGEIPTMITEALEWLHRHKESLRGDVWRLSQKRLVEERVAGYVALMRQGVEVSFPPQEDCYVVTSLVLRYIRALPEGVLNARATTALVTAKGTITTLAVIVSALALPSRRLLARLFRHLETLVRDGTAHAGELARHIAPHLGRFSEGGEEGGGSGGEGSSGGGPKELVVPLEAMIAYYTEVFGPHKASMQL